MPGQGMTPLAFPGKQASPTGRSSTPAGVAFARISKSAHVRLGVAPTDVAENEMVTKPIGDAIKFVGGARLISEAQMRASSEQRPAVGTAEVTEHTSHW